MTIQFSGGIKLPPGGGFKVEIAIAPSLPTFIETFATWNPDDKHFRINLSNGNLTASHSFGDNPRFGVRSTISVSANKYYWEVLDNDNHVLIGVAQADWPVETSSTIELSPTYITYYSVGNVLLEGGPILDSWVTAGQAYNAGDLITIAFDNNDGKIWFGKNGTWGNVSNQTDPENGLNPAATFTPGTWFAALILQEQGFTSVTANFGATAFSHTVPTGFLAGFGDAA